VGWASDSLPGRRVWWSRVTSCVRGSENRYLKIYIIFGDSFCQSKKT